MSECKLHFLPYTQDFYEVGQCRAKMISTRCSSLKRDEGCTREEFRSCSVKGGLRIGTAGLSLPRRRKIPVVRFTCDSEYPAAAVAASYPAVR